MRTSQHQMAGALILNSLLRIEQISATKKYSADNKFKQHIFKWASHKSWMTDMAYNAHQEITFHTLFAQYID